MTLTIHFKLNGIAQTIQTISNRRLIDILRDDMQLTGTKEGCGIGECGACTVVMNQKAVNACLILAGQIDGAEITTVEGLASHSSLHLLQESFIKLGAIQCGFCTPGMLMSAYALLLKNGAPTEDEIKEAIAGNLCRCTGYKQIIAAIEQSAEELNDRHDKRS